MRALLEIAAHAANQRPVGEFRFRAELEPDDLTSIDLDVRVVLEMEFKELRAVPPVATLDHDLADELQLVFGHLESHFFRQLPPRRLAVRLPAFQTACGQGLAGFVGVADQQQAPAAPDRDVSAPHERISEPPTPAQHVIGEKEPEAIDAVDQAKRMRARGCACNGSASLWRFGRSHRPGVCPSVG